MPISITALVSILFLLITPLQASYSSDNESKLQAVYMYNFLKFVHWPDNGFSSIQDHYEICIIGKNPFGSLLDSWKTKKINNKTINISYSSSSKRIKKCHMVFIGQTDNKSYINSLNDLQGRGILTVSANKKFAQRGGIIGFVMYKNRVRFNINRTIAQKKGLDINSKLLELAISIY